LAHPPVCLLLRLLVQNCLWFEGCLPSPICMPDHAMGPDLLCFVKVPSRTTPILLGFQVWAGRQKTLLSAARTLNPALYWLHSVGLMQTMSSIYADFLFLFQRGQDPKEYDNAISSAIDNIQGPLGMLGINLAEKGSYVGILASRYSKTWSEDVHEAVGHHYTAVLKDEVFQNEEPFHLGLPRENVRSLFDGLKPDMKRIRSKIGYEDVTGLEKQWRDTAMAHKRQRIEAAVGGSTKRARQSPKKNQQLRTGCHQSSGPPSLTDCISVEISPSVFQICS
jgi:hypothetical protein